MTLNASEARRILTEEIEARIDYQTAFRRAYLSGIAAEPKAGHFKIMFAAKQACVELEERWAYAQAEVRVLGIMTRTGFEAEQEDGDG
jgi:hypothetical protein